MDLSIAADEQLLLGARTLEGLNLRIDAARKKLVAAGPLPALSPYHGPSIGPLPGHGK